MATSTDKRRGCGIPALIWFGFPSVLIIVVATLVAGADSMPPWAVLITGLVVLNSVTLFLFRQDKLIAIANDNDSLPDDKKLTRVPEFLLLAMVFFLGTLGGFLGMYAFEDKHKNRKQPFVTFFWLIVIGQVVVISVLLLLATGIF